jgi:hypothetical protein
MNAKSLLAIAAVAVVASTGVRAETFSHWTPDAPTAQAFPSLAQGAASGKTRAQVQADTRTHQPLTAHQWSPDALAADAFPALRELPATSAQTRTVVRSDVLGGFAARPVSEREGA